MIDPVAVSFQLGGMTIAIHWYGIIIAVGMLLGILLAMYHAKREGYDSDKIIDLALLTIPLAIIGARVYYVIFQWNTEFAGKSFMDIIAIWNGGLAIYGGVIGGLIAVWLFTRFNKSMKLMNLLDVLAPSLILGQAIGRWGNFVNQEAYGNPITDPAWQWFPVAVYINIPKNIGEATGYYMATFFYESMWNLLVFAFLFLYYKNSKKRQPGNVFWFYLLLYGIGRVVIEGLRTDSLYMGNIRVSQALSAVLVAAAAIVLIVNAVRRNRGEAVVAPLDDSLRLMDKQAEEEAEEQVEAEEETEVPVAAEEATSEAADAEEPSTEAESVAATEVESVTAEEPAAAPVEEPQAAEEPEQKETTN